MAPAPAADHHETYEEAAIPRLGTRTALRDALVHGVLGRAPVVLDPGAGRGGHRASCHDGRRGPDGGCADGHRLLLGWPRLLSALRSPGPVLGNGNAGRH